MEHWQHDRRYFVFYANRDLFTNGLKRGCAGRKRDARGRGPLVEPHVSLYVVVYIGTYISFTFKFDSSFLASFCIKIVFKYGKGVIYKKINISGCDTASLLLLLLLLHVFLLLLLHVPCYPTTIICMIFYPADDFPGEVSCILTKPLAKVPRSPNFA